jgi:hypothetical protein
MEERAAIFGPRFLTVLGRAVALVVVSASWPVVAADDAARALPPSQAAAPASLTPFEQFKRFLENPPPIEHLVVKQTIFPPSLPKGAPKAGSVRSWEARYFEARWQPSVGVFYRDLPSLEALTNYAVGRSLVSCYGPDHWLVDGMNWIEHWTDHPQAPDRDNNITRVTRFRLQVLWETLTLGVQHLEAGKIKWVGNTFTAHTPKAPGLEEFDISGEALADTNGLPSAMKLTYSWLGRKANWITKYRFEKPLGFGWLPSRIEQYWSGRLLGEYEILEIRTATEPLPAPIFDPAQFVAAHKWDTRVLTNNAAYVLEPSGNLKFVESLAAGPQSHPTFLSHQGSVQVSYALLLGFNLWLFILAVRVKKTKTQNQPTATRA